MEANISVVIPDKGASREATQKLKDEFHSWVQSCPKGIQLNIQMKSGGVWYNETSIINSNGESASVGDYIEMTCVARETPARGRITELDTKGSWKRIIMGSVSYSLESINDFKILSSQN